MRWKRPKEEEPTGPKEPRPLFGDRFINTIRCIDCAYLAGSDRTPRWLFAEEKGYCDAVGHKGGRWNVLQAITELRPPCAFYERAPQERIDLRIKAVGILKEALQKPSLILRPENFCLLHKLNFYANDCSGYF